MVSPEQNQEDTIAKDPMWGLSLSEVPSKLGSRVGDSDYSLNVLRSDGVGISV